MAQGRDRIDGWKAIAAHFGRERSTVMRWARERALPVHRVPGGGTASVHAFVHELDGWLTRNHSAEPVSDVPAPDAPPALARRLGRPLLIAALALALVAAILVPRLRSASPVAVAPHKALPDDPRIAEIYLRARDDWAARSAASLQRAVAGFGTVVGREPGFAPAHAGLADTYLLLREFGTMPEAVAYPRAEAAADAALAVDPGSADAYRARGFIAYWWHRDIPAARAAFARALALAPDAAQTHFWLGNALVSNGEFAAGLHELDRARLLAPGSRAILADYGWALWASGQRAAGRAQLNALAGDASPAPHNLLATIALLEGDDRGYLIHAAARAQRLGDPALAARVAGERTAFEQGGTAELHRIMLAEARTAIAASARPDSCWAAVLAAQTRDRARLLAILTAADARRERWACGGLTGPAFATWARDTAVTGLVAARRGETLLPKA